jgi:hypothetical protein
MAALLAEDDLRPSNPVGAPDQLTSALYGDAAQPVSQADIARHSTTTDAIRAAMPELVKGAGLARKGGNMPLEDPAKITVLAAQAAVDLRTEIRRGYANKADVVKSLNGGFMSQFGALRTALSQPSIGEQIAQVLGQLNPDLTRSFTAGNLGIGSVE